MRRYSFPKKPDDDAAPSTPTHRKTSVMNGANSLNDEEIDSVRRFSSDLHFKSLDELKSNRIIDSSDVAPGSSGPSSLLSTESSSSSGVYKYNATKPEASLTSPPQVPTRSTSRVAAPVVDESQLFLSLEPAECKKVEAEFEKLTSETDLKDISESEKESPAKPKTSPSRRKSSTETSSSSSIPFADEDTIGALVPGKTTEPGEEAVNSDVTPHRAKPPRDLPAFKARLAEEESEECDLFSPDSNNGAGAGEAPATASSSNNSVKKGANDSSSEVDEFQDEIHFDPTIGSGQIGYKEGGFRNTPITDATMAMRTPQPAQQPIYQNNQEVDAMTTSEAERMLSTEKVQVLSDEQAKEVVALLTPEKELPPLPLEESSPNKEQTTTSDIGSSIESSYSHVTKHVDDAVGKLDSLVYNNSRGSSVDPSSSPVKPADEPKPKTAAERAKDTFYDENNDVHFYPDGHYWFQIPSLPSGLDDDEDDALLPDHCYKAPGRLHFSNAPIIQFSTFAVEDYDRRNEDVDPVAASAEYELEKRVEKMDTFAVDLHKGSDGLGLSIIGMGVGADTGLEKLGIFVKTITPSGAAERDGRIKVNDQIIEVDGKSLVGVTQAYAASVLRNTAGVLQFVIGRDKDPENSEVAQLIRQSLQVRTTLIWLNAQKYVVFCRILKYRSSKFPFAILSTLAICGREIFKIHIFSLALLRAAYR